MAIKMECDPTLRCLDCEKRLSCEFSLTSNDCCECRFMEDMTCDCRTQKDFLINGECPRFKPIIIPEEEW